MKALRRPAVKIHDDDYHLIMTSSPRITREPRRRGSRPRAGPGVRPGAWPGPGTAWPGLGAARPQQSPDGPAVTAGADGAPAAGDAHGADERDALEQRA